MNTSPVLDFDHQQHGVPESIFELMERPSEPSETVTDDSTVIFCGDKFPADQLLGIPVGHETPRLAEFIALVQALNRQGILATDGGVSEPIFVATTRSALFRGALQRMTIFTAWKVESLTSKINPTEGIDFRVIVQQ